MLNISDEYKRDYVFDPEIIRRKDSIEMHHDRIKISRQRKKNFSRRFRSFNLDAEKTIYQSEDSIAMEIKRNIIDVEVEGFHTVCFNWINDPARFS